LITTARSIRGFWHIPNADSMKPFKQGTTRVTVRRSHFLRAKRYTFAHLSIPYFRVVIDSKGDPYQKSWRASPSNLIS
jgi:hypothetical protein